MLQGLHNLVRLAEYGDETRCLSRHSIDLGSPRPNAGEGLGVRGILHC